MPTETSTMEVRCCIAGGGPAGMVLGFLLARAGIEVWSSKNTLTFYAIFAATQFTHPLSN